MAEPTDKLQGLSWYQSFVPSTVTLHSIRTGAQIQEPSLVALEIDATAQRQIPFCIEEGFGAPLPALKRCLAVGRAALEYQNTPGMAVFSPLRCGQIADYTAAQYLFRGLLEQLRPKFSLSTLFKPVICIHVQEHTTEVEERALIDAGIQLGARRVLLYWDSLPAMLERAQNDPRLRNGYILHIEPQEERGAA